jgi:hypothetical protein
VGVPKAPSVNSDFSSILFTAALSPAR